METLLAPPFMKGVTGTGEVGGMRLIWPEAVVFLFNSVENQSHKWGVLPWHWYWSRIALALTVTISASRYRKHFDIAC